MERLGARMEKLRGQYGKVGKSRREKFGEEKEKVNGKTEESKSRTHQVECRTEKRWEVWKTRRKLLKEGQKS